MPREVGQPLTELSATDARGTSSGVLESLDFEYLFNRKALSDVALQWRGWDELNPVRPSALFRRAKDNAISSVLSLYEQKLLEKQSSYEVRKICMYTRVRSGARRTVGWDSLLIGERGHEPAMKNIYPEIPDLNELKLPKAMAMHGLFEIVCLYSCDVHSMVVRKPVPRQRRCPNASEDLGRPQLTQMDRISTYRAYGNCRVALVGCLGVHPRALSAIGPDSQPFMAFRLTATNGALEH
ncbi:hypothetical protein QAD02_012467 [Eretmocerus hayati]|uniref:Uncharacterized protein n=1 Tax=Eretmocerus hayati TaxID=131215 RepID=A0ACC2P4J8_9HYME|nr:hypothetical protein QAD02_012467 [Eretmocerus hayati]